MWAWTNTPKGGTHLHLIVPAMLAPLAAAYMPERHLHGVSNDVQAFLPALKVAAFELNKLPDVDLVEVRDSRDHVRISKAGNGLKIEVDSPREHVDVWVPLRAAYDAAGTLQSRFENEK